MGINTRIDLLIQRRTKIIATLGPASSEVRTISRLLRAGVNVLRLNMSHGAHATHMELIKNIRSATRATGISAAVMADLCGPKIRTGKFEGGVATLKRGDRVTVTVRKVKGTAGLISSQYSSLHKDVKLQDNILLNDGRISLEVKGIEDTEIRCRVVHGGVVSNHKGINLPDSLVSAPALTSKDRKDAQFALSQGVDYLSLSFVRTAKEIGQLRRLIKKAGGSAHIISKIETHLALENIDEILDASDSIMVARGDLGVELKPEQVPVAQLQLINKARHANRPVIVATQVLESMIENARPTRAEVSDISYAVASGADAMMLSAETSVGRFPVDSVRIMDRAIRNTESYCWRFGDFDGFAPEGIQVLPLAFGHAISNATSQLSRDLLIRAIVVISHSGMSAATVSAARPAAPIIAITDNENAGRRMLLMWGVIPSLSGCEEVEDTSGLARRHARKFKLASPGDHILLVQGFHADPFSNMPSVSILQV